MKRFLFDATYKSYLPIFVALGSIMAIHAAFKGDSQLLGMVACGAAYVLGIVHYDIEDFIVKLYNGFTSEYIITREPKEEMRDRVLKVAGGMVSAGQAVWLDADNKVRAAESRPLLGHDAYNAHQGAAVGSTGSSIIDINMSRSDISYELYRRELQMKGIASLKEPTVEQQSEYEYCYDRVKALWKELERRGKIDASKVDPSKSEAFSGVDDLVTETADPSPSGPSDCREAATKPIGVNFSIMDDSEKIDPLNPKQYDNTSGPIIPDPALPNKKGL